MHDWELERRPKVEKLRQPREQRITVYPASSLILRFITGSLLLMLLGLLYFDTLPTLFGWQAPSIVSQFGEALHPGRWLITFLQRISVNLIQYVVLGGLTYTVYHLRKRAQQVTFVDVRRRPVLLFGLAPCLILACVRASGMPNLLSLSTAYFAFCIGVWITSACFRGRRAVAWLIPQFASLTVVLFGLGVLCLTLTLSSKPLSFNVPPVAPQEKARLAEAVRATEKLDNGVERLQLTEHDVDLILATGFERLPLDGKADVQMKDGHVGADLSLKLPWPTPFGQFINSQGACELAVDQGELTFRPERLQIGNVTIPALALRVLGHWAATTIEHDQHASAAIQTVEQLTFSEQGVEAIFHRKALRAELKTAVQTNFGESRETLAATKAHLEHLVTNVDALPKGDKQFLALTSEAFRFAKQRTAAGADPVEENRAAILALGILLGHARVATLAGSLGDSELLEAAERYTGKVTLRGRRDLTRHFYVSAALAVFTNDLVSDGAGLLKEEIDSGQGGSGFSFADLMADRAGTRFAVAATQHEGTARRTQQLISAGISIDDIFSSAEDLPDGISATQFQEEFGGVNGPKYNAICEEMDSRLDTCQLLVIHES